MLSSQISRHLERDGPLSAALLDGLLDISGLLVVVLEQDGSIRVFNRACEQVTGYAAEDVLGRNLFEALIPAEEADAVRAVAARLADDLAPNEFTNHWLTRTGSRRLIHWRNGVLPQPDGGTPLLLGTGIDITFQEEAERTLRNGRDRMERIVDALPGAAVQLDSDYRIVYSNWGYRAWFDLDTNPQLGRHIRDIIGHHAFDLLRREYDRALAGGQGNVHGIVPFARGGPRFIHGNYIPSRDDANRITGLYALELDLSRQEQLRRQLGMETRRGRTIMEHAIDGIIIINEGGIIQSFNPAAERIFGHPAATMIGRPVTALMPEPDRSNHADYIQRYVDTGEPRIIGSGREVVGLHRDGHAIDIRLALAEVIEGGQRFFVGFTSDITARKQAELQAREHLRQLAQLDRRAAMSELTTDLAHELSQPLTAIRTAAGACLSLQDGGRLQPEVLSRALTQISAQAQRASEIIRQVRSFVRGGQPEFVQPEDLSALVNNVLPLLQHDMQNHAIELRREAAGPLPPCPLNRIQIEQVLFNLVRNAIEAMTGQTGERVLTIACSHDPGQDCCRVSVADTGPGIDPADLERVFEPYFTTRPHGLGQGLAICRSILDQHGGSLTADNRPDGGAQFAFTLPCSAAATIHVDS